ncbi:MAG: phage tail assembly chaperone [Hyphomicrobiaceae bacterium]|nr:phage tail assembly chaperone [Hyphomicrobiaceae bacterium]
MAIGFGVLRLAPAHFWSMTPRELAAASRGISGIALGSPGLDRTRMDELMARFPD